MSESRDTTECENAAAFQRLSQALLPFVARGPQAVEKTGSHHLYFERHKGWMLRVTVQVGKKVVGKRLKFRLGTRDLTEAEKARELVLATLRRLGLKVILRNQRRGKGTRDRVVRIERGPEGEIEKDG